ARIESLPLKTRHVIGTGDGAIAAANTFLRRPTHNAGFRILVQSLEGTAGSARGIETVHALALHERGRRAVLWFIQLDNVAGEIVEVGGGLVQGIAAGIGGRIVRLGAS